MLQKDNNSTVQKKIVSLSINKEYYGLEIDAIKEIITLPGITKIPNTPSYFKGIINLRGEIISVIDLSKLFGLTTINKELSRIIVVYWNLKLIGLLVDEVAEVLSIEDSDIQPPPSMAQDEKAKYINGVIHLKGKEDMILLVDLPELIGGSHKKKEVLESKKAVDESSIKKGSLDGKVLTFLFKNELYAINLNYIKEIIQTPEITVMPNTPFVVRGIISVRNEIIPVIYLHSCFGIGDINENNKFQSIIIIEYSGTVIGILADKISEVLLISEDRYVLPPPILNVSRTKQISQVIKIATGKENKLALLLDINKLFSAEDKQALMDVLKDREQDKTGKRETGIKETINIVTFRTAEDTFGININEVNEIIIPSEIIPVPGAAGYIEGIINLRGVVIPVINLRKKFNFQLVKETDQTRIIILTMDEMKTGIIVDTMDSVQAIEKSLFKPPPEAIATVENKYIESVAQLDNKDKVILLLNIKNLLSPDLDDLNRITKKTP